MYLGIFVGLWIEGSEFVLCWHLPVLTLAEAPITLPRSFKMSSYRALNIHKEEEAYVGEIVRFESIGLDIAKMQPAPKIFH